MSEPDLVIDATTIAVDLRANTLAVLAPVPPEVASLLDVAGEAIAFAMIDIGTRGRLLGIELERGAGIPLVALAIADPTPADTAVLRSARIPVSVSLRDVAEPPGTTLSIVFSRHGEDYDISWPSGNQCWRRSASGRNGAAGIMCAVVASS